MLFVIIGIIFAVIAGVWFYSTSGDAPVGLSIAIGIIAGAFLSGVAWVSANTYFWNSNDVYVSLEPETFSLRQTQDGYWCESADSGASISVYVWNADNSYTKATFASSQVTFQDGHDAQVTIEKETVVWSEQQKFWFFREPLVKEKIASVIITVPSSNSSDEVSTTPPSGLSYCTQCGSELDGTENFCSQCGHQIDRNGDGSN